MLEELQSLDAAKKKQVLIISTIIIMIIVIGVWFTYFNSIVIGSNNQAASQEAAASAVDATTTPAVPIAITPTPPAVPAQASGPSIWQDIGSWFGSLGHIFSKPSQYNIQPQSN